MVRKIGKKNVHGGRLWLPPPPAPSLCLTLEPRQYVRSEKFVMDRCPKDEPTAKTLVCKRARSIPEKIGKNLLGWHPPPPPPRTIGG